MADAERARNKLVKALPTVLGTVVVYKAGFTNEASQKRVFEVPVPAYGAMFGRRAATYWS